MYETMELKINMLGEFSLSYGENRIVDQHARSGKLWSLLEYLVSFRDKEVSQNELIELLWPDDDSVSDPSNTLKTLLHRVRSLLGQLDEELKKTITYRRGSYRWISDIPCRIDAEDFDNLCKTAATLSEPDEKLEVLLQAIDLYRGDFLPHSALETWVIPINTYYRSQYIKAVYDSLEILTDGGKFNHALDICKKAINIDPYDEGLHLQMIHCLLATGAQRAALQHYNYVTDLYFTQFGISPSVELTAIYRDIVKTDKDMELDLSIIKEDLQEISPDSHAYECEYEFFKDIYRLEARGVARSGQVIHVALISITSALNKDLTQKQTNTAMDRLREIIASSLRRNDVYSRYSVTQYIILLPSATFENSQAVMNRILSAYRSQYSKTPATLQYKILPLDPMPTT